MARAAILAILLAAAPAAAQSVPTVIARPTYLRLDAGFGAPTGLFGFTVGHTIEPPAALELGAGLGLSGWQLAVLARVHVPLGSSPWHSFSAAAGPSLSFIGGPFTQSVPHADHVEVDEDDLFTIFGVNAELGWEWRQPWGGLIRVALGGFYRVSENMSHLCPEGTYGEGSSCAPPHLASAPEIARLLAYPYLVFGYGFSF
jgi:hypothetical protein